nr:protein tonB2-like [Aegilops tauschii subsp. strangulata]
MAVDALHVASWAYNYVDRNPSPHLVQPLLDPPSPRSSSARFRARKLCGHHCLTLVTAATVLAVPQEHVQEVRQGRLRPFRASIRAEALRSSLHLHLLRTAATTSSSLPLLRDSPDLLTSSTRTGVSSSLGSLFFVRFGRPATHYCYSTAPASGRCRCPRLLLPHELFLTARPPAPLTARRRTPCSSCHRPLLLERAPAPFRAPPPRATAPPPPPTVARLPAFSAAVAPNRPASITEPPRPPPPLRDRLPRGSASAPRCRAQHLAMPAATGLAAVLRPARDRPCPAAIPCARAGFAPHTPATLPPVLAPWATDPGAPRPFF